MSQERIFTFLDLNTSKRHNDRFVGIIKPGVYRGFFPRASVVGVGRIDITKGNDTDSIAVTDEGVIIKEDTDVSGAVKVDFSTLTLERIDLCVCEYTYTTNTTTAAIYKIIKGVPVPSSPVPASAGLHQIPLFYIHVRVGATSIVQTDLWPATKANSITSSEIGPLQPMIDPTNMARIYVRPGAFPSRTGTSLLVFNGGYAAAITSTDINDGETKYFIFGVTDSLTISQIESSFVANTISGFGSDSLPICIAKVVRTGVVIRITELTDLRTAFTRRITPQFEEDTYTDLLASSIFKYVRYDLFDDDSLIDLATISTTDVTVEVDPADTSLTITKNIPGLLAADVTIVTEDLINGTGLSAIYYIMMLMDTPNTNILFDYSTASKYGGFTGTYKSFNDIVRIVQGAANLYIRFKITFGDLNLGPVKIFSYGLFLEMDYDNLNTNSLNTTGLIETVRSQQNIIQNPFIYWSRPDDSGAVTPLCGRLDLNYALATQQEQIDGRQKCYGPDGWQLVQVDADPTDVVSLKKVYRASANQPGMRIYIDSMAAPHAASFTLEHRVPLSGLSDGRKISFAVDYVVAPTGSFRIGLQFYTVVNGALTLQGSPKFETPYSASGTVVVQSDSAVGYDTDAVGFIIQYTGVLATGNYLTVYGPRAVFGQQSEVIVFPDTSPSLSLPYYERGRSVATLRDVENADIATTASLVQKYSFLGDLVVNGVGADNSIHVTGISYEVEEGYLVVSGLLQKSGSARLDVGWQTYVHYNVVEV